MAEASDTELVARTRDGDPSAFETLVRRHSPRVYAVALAMMRSPADAHDVVQETFLSAWRRLDAWRADAAFTTWLHRIAVNACLMRMRTRRRRPEGPLEPWPDGELGAEDLVDDFAPRVDELLASRQLGALVLEAADALPDDYRAVWALADVHEFGMKDIALALDLSVPNVKTRLHRARLRIRRHLLHHVANAPSEEEVP